MNDPKITEAGLQYLRNINTRPGPNAGKAIDKSLPPYGPTPASADVIEGMREALETALEVMTADTIGTIDMDDPDWYRALDKAVRKVRAALALPDSKPEP